MKTIYCYCKKDRVRGGGHENKRDIESIAIRRQTAETFESIAKTRETVRALRVINTAYLSDIMITALTDVRNYSSICLLNVKCLIATLNKLFRIGLRLESLVATKFQIDKILQVKDRII